MVIAVAGSTVFLDCPSINPIFVKTIPLDNLFKAFLQVYSHLDSWIN